MPLSISPQPWQDVSMDFLTGNSLDSGFPAILIEVDRLTKEPHYVPCFAREKKTLTKKTTELLIQYVFLLYGLSDTILSDPSLKQNVEERIVPMVIDDKEE